jgi:alanyl-tRNA synthetase
MTTERLFDRDSYQSAFQASVLHVTGDPAHPKVVLDRTLFFPRSGGQEADRGWIDSVPVVDVYEEGEAIAHVLEGPLVPHGPIEGRIDWGRRFDQMQQHTGQHMLSQAFWRLGQEKTVGFHLGEKDSTIDLEIKDLDTGHVTQVEDAVNRVVFENRNVIVKEIPYDALDMSMFRKKPAERPLVRVVEVEGYDSSGCCGTHVRRTGEVGLVKIQRWERYKGNVRVVFVCGQRALQDYRKRMGVLNQICRTLTAGEEEIQKRLDNLLDEHQSAGKRLKTLSRDLVVYESGEWAKAGTPVGPYQLFRDRKSVV